MKRQARGDTLQHTLPLQQATSPGFVPCIRISNRRPASHSAPCCNHSSAAVYPSIIRLTRWRLNRLLASGDSCLAVVSCPLSCGSSLAVLARTESIVRRFVLVAGVVIYILQHSPSTGRWIREIASRLSTIIASRGGLPTWQPTNSSFPDRRDLIRSRWTLVPTLLDLESGQFDAGWTLCTRCTARSPRKPQTRDLHTRSHTTLPHSVQLQPTPFRTKATIPFSGSVTRRVVETQAQSRLLFVPPSTVHRSILAPSPVPSLYSPRPPSSRLVSVTAARR
ncbi:hypothetical protein BKA56DRAFT_215014 [Ilyonectria sp. MPI-CAGE-AT-0026]|nr:hypothetical protein BKA56DRAFT_215014 [Ilyonectria sp. MPI-CAGE-AT-0026]